jgi:uncharacterized protein
MKFFLILAILFLGVWVWRSSRLSDRQSRRQPPQQTPTDMVCCRQCGVHTPKTDAVTGKLGVYCCVEHRQSSES